MMFQALRGSLARQTTSVASGRSSSVSCLLHEQSNVRAFATEKKKKMTWRKLQRIQEAKRNPQAVQRRQPPRAKVERHNYLMPAQDDGKKWRILSASVLERLPVIQPDPEQWEVDFETVQHELNLRENQRLEDDFWFLEPGAEYLTPEEAPKPDEADDPEEIVGAGFQLAPRETEDDEKNNRKSLNRALKGRLFLLVKNDASSKFPWFFPVGEKQEDEKMRDAAVRSLQAHCGAELQVYPVGFAPMGYIKYLHEDDGKSGFDGTKIFFYRAQLVAGDVSLDASKSADYEWVTHRELMEYLEPATAEYVQKMLPA